MGDLLHCKWVIRVCSPRKATHLPDGGVLKTVVLVGLSKAGLKDGILRFPLLPTEIHGER